MGAEDGDKRHHIELKISSHNGGWEAQVHEKGRRRGAVGGKTLDHQAVEVGDGDGEGWRGR